MDVCSELSLLHLKMLPVERYVAGGYLCEFGLKYIIQSCNSSTFNTAKYNSGSQGFISK